MAGITLAKYIADWELLSTALEPQLLEMPHLTGEAQQLDELINEAKALDAEQQSLRGRSLQTTRRRREVEAEGRDLRSRVIAQLRGKLGFENELLLGFGAVPRRKRRKPPVKEPETPAPQEDAAELSV